MFDVLAKAALPIADERRRTMLGDHGERLMEQARKAISGPDLAMVEDRFRRFEDEMSA